MGMMKSIAIELEEASTEFLQAVLNGDEPWDSNDWLLWKFRNNELVRGYIKEELSKRKGSCLN